MTVEQFKERFGRRIKSLRTQKRLSQKTLASQCGISTASIMSYELGQKQPNLFAAFLICEALGTDLTTLCGESTVGVKVSMAELREMFGADVEIVGG